MTINAILDKCIELNASDVNITSEQNLSMRINKDIYIFSECIYQLSVYDVQDICSKLIGNDSFLVDLYSPMEKDGSYQYRYFKDKNDIMGKVYYFRYNVALTAGEIHITIRKLIDEILPLEKIGLHEGEGFKFYKSCMQLKEGLNLCVGATGSGKSTTLATIIHEQLLLGKIKTITLEAPIEYYFPCEKYVKSNSIIVQREVPLDSPSFGMGLRAAMRQNPDVIFVGEIRDPETAEAALQAANTGHTVMATLHASSAVKAFERLKFLVGNITNDYSFINSIMFQKLIKENGKVIPYRETVVFENGEVVAS